jgi:hypothetical protein
MQSIHLPITSDTTTNSQSITGTMMVIQSRRTSASETVAIAIRAETTGIEGVTNTIIQTIHSSVTTIRLGEFFY